MSDQEELLTNLSTNSSSNSQNLNPNDFLLNWHTFCKYIFEQTELCQRYAYLNRKIPSNFNLKEGAQI
jgi:hypothetical protein